LGFFIFSDDAAPTPDESIKLEVEAGDQESLSNDEAAQTKQYTCDKCGRCFGSKAKVAHHLQTAHFVAIGTGKFQCDICFQRFKVNKSLQSHKRVVHEHQRYECAQCDSSYTTKFMLDLHVLDKHSLGEPVHECDVCHRKFGHERVLKNHIKSHKVKKTATEETGSSELVVPKTLSTMSTRPCNRKSHICHICGSSFKGKSR
jgi:Zinc-finger double-stranded RNA-binding/Zinc finger, C2H2 type